MCPTSNNAALGGDWECPQTQEPHEQRGQKGKHAQLPERRASPWLETVRIPSSKLLPSQGDSTRKYSPPNILKPNCVLLGNPTTSEKSKDGRGLWQNDPSAPIERTPTEAKSNMRVDTQNPGLRLHDKMRVGAEVLHWDPSGKVFALATPETHVREKTSVSNVFENSFRSCSLRGVRMPSYTAETNNENHQSGKAFAHVAVSESHGSTRTREKNYKCEDCRRTFAYHSFLMQHMKIHTGEKPYECEACGKAFRYSLHLNKHFARHMAEKSHKCKECGKAFRKASDLTKHVRIHTGERPYLCKVCGRGFSVHSGLKSHLKKHS